MNILLFGISRLRSQPALNLVPGRISGDTISDLKLSLLQLSEKQVRPHIDGLEVRDLAHLAAAAVRSYVPARAVIMTETAWRAGHAGKARRQNGTGRRRPDRSGAALPAIAGYDSTDLYANTTAVLQAVQDASGPARLPIYSVNDHGFAEVHYLDERPGGRG